MQCDANRSYSPVPTSSLAYQTTKHPTALSEIFIHVSLTLQTPRTRFSFIEVINRWNQTDTINVSCVVTQLNQLLRESTIKYLFITSCFAGVTTKVQPDKGQRALTHGLVVLLG